MKGLIFDCSSNQVNPHTKAQIFFGIYESAEYRFCEKYIPSNSNIIEFGSSIGFLSSFIANEKSPKSIISVEANPDLIPVILSNFKLNNVRNFQVINKAIGTSILQNVWFSRGDDSSTGSISTQESAGAIKVECTTLYDLIKSSGVQQYVLICDIEGAEIDIFLAEDDALEACTLLIIEVHHVSRADSSYGPYDIVREIEKKGFKKQDGYGHTLVFIKS
jgi:FkbM family methyltransferase